MRCELSHISTALSAAPDLHTTFIGSGDAFEATVALARELRSDDMVEFIDTSQPRMCALRQT
jgi:hypothetical protein